MDAYQQWKKEQHQAVVKFKSTLTLYDLAAIQERLAEELGDDTVPHLRKLLLQEKLAQRAGFPDFEEWKQHRD